MMELPIVAPAPVVTAHAGVFRDRCETRWQWRPFQHDLTGRIVLPHTRMAHSARGILESADHTHLARVLSEAPWREDALHRRRLRCLLQQPTPPRRRRRASRLARAESAVCTRGESLCRRGPP